MHMVDRVFRCLKLATIYTIFCSLTASVAFAEDEDSEGKEGAPQAETHYVPLKPSFVTNYQSRRLRYFKTDISIVASSAATVEAIKRHEIHIRHNLVMLFSNQDQTTLNSQEGKQKLQEEALDQVVSVLTDESEPTDVSGILFTSFIVE